MLTDTKAMPPPTQHELGRDEEKNRISVEAKLRRIDLARRRLGDLDGTLFAGALQLIHSVLSEYHGEVMECLQEWYVVERVPNDERLSGREATR